jgi:hypothetical protein
MGEVQDFHSRIAEVGAWFIVDVTLWILRKAAVGAAFTEIDREGCTKSGHRPVNGLHSIEKTDS